MTSGMNSRANSTRRRRNPVEFTELPIKYTIYHLKHLTFNPF